MEHLPKVSVIIPLYEQNQYIPEAIESVLAQQYKNIEIIIVDDGAVDFPSDIIHKFAGKIQVFHQNHSGPSSAKNTGLEHSSGEFIQFLDADDLIAPEKIRVQISHFLDNPGVSICYCNHVLFDETIINKQSYLYRVPGRMTNPVLELIDFRKVYPIPLHSALTRKNVFSKIGGFNDHLRTYEDREFFIRAASSGNVFGHEDFFGAFYRQHAGNATKKEELMFNGFITYIDILEKEFTAKGLMTEEIKYLLADNCYLNLHRVVRQSLKHEYSDILSKKIKFYQSGYLPPDCGKVSKLLFKIFGINRFRISIMLAGERVREWAKTIIKRKPIGY